MQLFTTFAAGFGDTINRFGALLGIGSLLVLAFVYLYSTAKKGRQDIIRQDNADLRASNQEMRTQRAGDEARIKEQQESIRQLRDIATQTPAVTKLIEMNNRQQKLIGDQHSQVIAELSGFTSQISKLATEFSSLAKAINHDYKKGERK